MHDLVVGLICFDTIYLPLSALGRTHMLLGSSVFWHLVGEKALRFIHLEKMPVIVYPSKESVYGGDLGMITAGSGSLNDPQPRTIDEIIRKHLIPVPGKEVIAEAQFANLESMVIVFSDKDSIPTHQLVQGSLLHPAVRRLLGLSDAILPTSIPRWLMLPVLRLAHVINVAQVCDYFHIAATKIAFGGEKLAGVAFAVAAARNWADEIATYVLAGRLYADIGQFIGQDPTMLHAIMKFRDTEEGARLRKDILDQLSVNDGSEFLVSVNAGLKQNIPPHILEKARDRLSSLLLATGRQVVTPAVWSNKMYSDKSLKLWRNRSMQLLEQYCKAHGIRKYDLCPCGSGEKLKFCCFQALN